VLSLAPFASGPVLGRGPGREFIRHYTHLAERAEGLALGADLRLEAVAALLFDAPGALARSAPALSVGGDGGAVVARALPRAPTASERWLLRRSRPEVGFASVEVTLPWLPAAVAGVNEAGLAVALAPGDAPAVLALLVQEGLQRFGDLASALDWCLKRPGEGRGTILLADECGASAAVHFEDAVRRVERGDPSGGLVAGDPTAASELRKRLEEGIVGAEAALTALEAVAPGADRVALLPDRRRLRWVDDRGVVTEVDVLPEAAPA
jgi:hypothetical protein